MVLPIIAITVAICLMIYGALHLIADISEWLDEHKKIY
jgi:hypothetical protein